VREGIVRRGSDPRKVFNEPSPAARVRVRNTRRLEALGSELVLANGRRNFNDKCLNRLEAVLPRSSVRMHKAGY